MDNNIILVNNNRARYIIDGVNGFSDIKDIPKIKGSYYCNIPLGQGNLVNSDIDIYKDINKIYPLRDILEILPTPMLKRIREEVDYSLVNTNTFYNNIFLKSIFLIYQNKFTYNSEYFYPKINHTNKTRRVTLGHDNINLTAISKEKREVYLSHPDYTYITFDYVSHHLSIMSNILGHKLLDFHTHVAEILNIPREDAKLINFKVLYGYDADKYMDKVPLYKSIVDFRKTLFEFYQKNKYILSPISNEEYYFDVDIKEGTLLSYFVQIYEAEKMAKIIVELKEQLTNIDISYLIYDSASIRYKKTDKIDINLFYRIVTENNNYSIDIEYVNN